MAILWVVVVGYDSENEEGFVFALLFYVGIDNLSLATSDFQPSRAKPLKAKQT